MGPRLCLLAHCEGELRHHCDPLTPRSPWGRQEASWWILWAQWAGGLGAPVALGTPMAMAERPGPGWASYHSSNTNCQDLGNSILLLLGLIICINISINMVTLVRVGPGGRALAGWRRREAWWPGPARGHCVLPHLALA